MKKLLSVLFPLVCVFAFTQESFTIVLDTGHGGKDKGAQNKGITEKDIVQDIAEYIYKLNDNKQIKLIRTIENDQFLDLTKRIAVINEIKPDLVISLHVNNASTDEQNGVEIYTSSLNQNAEKSETYAKDLLTYLQKDGILAQQNFLILAKSKAPAMTVELGYISNPGDLAYLNSKEGKLEIAQKFLAYFESLVK